MINLSKISNTSFVGKLLRLPLKLIPSKTVITILSGNLKGKSWIKGSGVNGYWLGFYEKENQKIFRELIKKGDIVFDVGAHVGFFTLLASALVGNKGEVFAFEPSKRNIEFLRKHVKLNQCRNIKLIVSAASDYSGIGNFDITANSFTGKLDKKTTQKEGGVKVITLNKFVDDNKISKVDFIKIDVEGEELKVLEGSRKIIAKFKPNMLISTHSQNLHIRCLEFVKQFGYSEIRDDFKNRRVVVVR